jgi:hypothetical protein
MRFDRGELPEPGRSRSPCSRSTTWTLPEPFVAAGIDVIGELNRDSNRESLNFSAAGRPHPFRRRRALTW